MNHDAQGAEQIISGTCHSSSQHEKKKRSKGKSSSTKEKRRSKSTKGDETPNLNFDETTKASKSSEKQKRGKSGRRSGENGQRSRRRSATSGTDHKAKQSPEHRGSIRRRRSSCSARKDVNKHDPELEFVDEPGSRTLNNEKLDMILRRPSLRLANPPNELEFCPSSEFEPSVCSRKSVTSVLQFDATKKMHVIKRKQDEKVRYSFQNMDGSKSEISIAKLVVSPQKKAVLASDKHDVSSLLDSSDDEDPFAASYDIDGHDEEEKLNHSILSLAISQATTGSSLSGFTEDEDAFSDFDPLEFPDHSHRPDDDGEHIMPDYLKAEEIPHRNGDESESFFDDEVAEDNEGELINIFPLITANSVQEPAKSPDSIPRLQKGDQEGTASSKPFLQGDEGDDDGADLEYPSSRRRRNRGAKSLNDSSASLIAMMTRYDDSSTSEEDEPVEDDESVCLTESNAAEESSSYGTQTSSKKSHEESSKKPAKGFGRAFSVKGIIRRTLYKRSNTGSSVDSSRSGSTASSIFKFKGPAQHSLMKDESDLS